MTYNFYETSLIILKILQTKCFFENDQNENEMF